MAQQKACWLAVDDKEAELTQEILRNYALPARVLLGLGLYDLLRGFMHTYALHWSAVTIAGFNVDTTPVDQFFMLGTFGISNFLTGFIYLLISKRAPQLSPTFSA